MPIYDKRNPFSRKSWTKIQFTIDWLESCLTNDENSTDEEMGLFFFHSGLDKKTVSLVMAQRDAALLDGIDFKLNIEGLFLDACNNGLTNH